MTLSRLQYFVAVAQERNFARAAARLHISRPALSQQIRRLEDELGQQLLMRTSHRVVLTPAGRALLPKARELVDDYRRLGGIVDEAARGATETLRVGANASSIIGLVPTVIAAYRGMRPQTAVLLEQQWDEQQLEMLRADELDVAIFRSLAPPDDLSSTPLPADPLHVCLPENHPLAAQSQVRWEQLAGESLLLPDRSRARIEADTVLGAFTANGIHPDVTVMTVGGYHGASWVLAGLGIWVVPGYATALRQDGTVFLPLTPAVPAMPLRIAMRQDELSRAARDFVATAASVDLPQRFDSLAVGSG